MIEDVTNSLKDWEDFWTNTMEFEEIIMDIDQLRKLREDIVEQIQVAFSVWGEESGSFQERSICCIVTETFLDNGIA